MSTHQQVPFKLPRNQFFFTFPDDDWISSMNTDACDPYADLSSLCGITAFPLPALPLPAPRPSTDHRTTDLSGPIPDHLLSRYLCYDPSPPLTAGAASASPELHSSSSIPYSPPPPSSATIHPLPEPLLVDSPSPCPNFTEPFPQPLVHDSPLPPPDFTASLAIASSPSDFITAPPSSKTLLHESLLSCNVYNPDSPASRPRHVDSIFHEREVLPPCVVNYQDSLYLIPEGEWCSYSGLVGVGDSDYEKWIPNLLPSEIIEMTLCDPNDVLAECDTEHFVSVMNTFKNFAFASVYGERLLSQIKKLVLWHKDVSLDDKECKIMVSFMTSFRDFAFSSDGRKNSLPEPSRKKQRKPEAKSKGVASSLHFTRSKSANDRDRRLF